MARFKAEGPPEAAHGTTSNAATATATTYSVARSRADGAKTAVATAAVSATKLLRKRRHLFVPLGQEARTLGGSAVLREVVVDELDVAELRRLRRHERGLVGRDLEAHLVL